MSSVAEREAHARMAGRCLILHFMSLDPFLFDFRRIPHTLLVLSIGSEGALARVALDSWGLESHILTPLTFSFA